MAAATAGGGRSRLSPRRELTTPTSETSENYGAAVVAGAVVVGAASDSVMSTPYT
jgi:hypothetical protein